MPYPLLRWRADWLILKILKISGKMETLIESYITLTRHEPFEIEVIKLLAKSIILTLSDLIPRAKPEQEYELLGKLELCLRTAIEEELSRATTNWWLERVPSDVRDSAERRMKSEQRLWPWLKRPTERSPLMYVNFSEYGKIILSKNN